MKYYYYGFYYNTVHMKYTESVLSFQLNKDYFTYHCVLVDAKILNITIMIVTHTVRSLR